MSFKSSPFYLDLLRRFEPMGVAPDVCSQLSMKALSSYWSWWSKQNKTPGAGLFRSSIAATSAKVTGTTLCLFWLCLTIRAGWWFARSASRALITIHLLASCARLTGLRSLLRMGAVSLQSWIDAQRLLGLAAPEITKCFLGHGCSLPLNAFRLRGLFC